MLVGACDGGKDYNEKTGSDGNMGQNGGREARMFIAQDQDGNHDESTTDSEQTGEKTHTASDQDEEKKINQCHFLKFKLSNICGIQIADCGARKSKSI
jgi:hypothetical protein